MGSSGDLQLRDGRATIGPTSNGHVVGSIPEKLISRTLLVFLVTCLVEVTVAGLHMVWIIFAADIMTFPKN